MRDQRFYGGEEGGGGGGTIEYKHTQVQMRYILKMFIIFFVWVL